MAAVSLLVGGVSYLACHFFAGRAAFLMTGATMATIMTANVFFVIIPGQRKVIELMRAGKTVDPIFGKRGKQRSVHNTYFTLPVLFTMLSNHFSLMTTPDNRWVSLVAVMASAVAIRQFYVLRHKGVNNWSVLAFAVVLLVGVFYMLAPNKSSALNHSENFPTESVYEIMDHRCVQCHSNHPTLMEVPPKGLVLDNRGDVDRQASAIYAQVVLSKAMPLGNVTNMTESEREVVKLWFEGR